MTGWLDTLARQLQGGRPATVVVVATVEGSSPREPGARMIVTHDDLFGTIGGGQLEFEALKCARDGLDGAPHAFTKRFPLGPELGQCCGGVVNLMFEPFTPADTAWVEQLRQQTSKPGVTLLCVESRSGSSSVSTTPASRFGCSVPAMSAVPWPARLRRCRSM
jgi:xanthine dehydrogenase accessory factor